MRDLTEGPILKHVVVLAVPIAIGMLFQTLYYLVDLFFVAGIGERAVAGVSAAGSIQFIVMALTQILGVGTMALIAQSSGRKDRDDANLIFNQSLILAVVCALMMLLGGYGFVDRFMATLGADSETQAEGVRYLVFFLPGLALQFALIAMGSALRGTGITKPTMVVQVTTVVLNAVLSPILIAGWLTGRPMGVAGAGLGTSISVAAGVVMMWIYFVKLEKYVFFDPTLLRPRIDAWRRILRIGLPAGGEFGLIFIFSAVTYWIIRGFGAEAQAGFGIGSRVMQSIFLPAMAITFAAAPVAGQNFGAGLGHRVRDTFRQAVLVTSVFMVALTLLCQVRPDILVRVFTDQQPVIDVGAEFLRIISWNFLAIGIVFSASSLFQAMGNTVPAVVASGTRLLTYALPGIWLSTRPGFELWHLWVLSVVTIALQAVLCLWLLRGELRRRLPAFETPVSAEPEAAGAKSREDRVRRRDGNRGW